MCSRALVAAATTMWIALWAPDAAACNEYGGNGMWLSAGLGLGAGAAASMTSSGVIDLADDTHNFSFGLGVAVGLGVTGALSVIYAIVDGSSDCAMADEQGGLAWTVPVTTGVVGALLPIAVWGAAGDKDEHAFPTTAPLVGPMSWTLRF